MQPVADKKYAIIGVVSFGYKCAEAGKLHLLMLTHLLPNERGLPHWSYYCNNDAYDFYPL